jgi:tetratricopeptide (TPR) repeat protein
MRACLLLVWLLLTGPGLAAGINALSEATYRQLARVHELMERENYTQALRSLDALAPKVQHNKYEKAMLLQTYAYLYTYMQRYASAIAAIQDSLALQALPKAVMHDLLYLSAELRAEEGDYKGALTDLRLWFAKENKPGPQAHALAGVVYANLGDTPAAIEHLEQAMQTANPSQLMTMRQLLAVYLKASRTRDAAKLLQRIIIQQADSVEDWRHLSAVYRQLGDDRSALAVLGLAHRRGLLQSEADLMALSSYYLYLELPYDAAKLLTAGLQQQRIKSTSENWELLADAWMRARDTHKALQSLKQAASLADTPQLHLKRARLAASMQEWEQVLQAATDALGYDALSDSGEAHLLAGIAHHHRGDRTAAHKALLQAQADPTTRARAGQWLEMLAQDDQ